MKKDKSKEIIHKTKSNHQNFDDLVQELQKIAQVEGCCSNQNACDLRCSPLNGGCNFDGENGCC